ncbi:MAG: protocatechuate 3,4-dioxygenase subunit alpha [Jatrophihabitantaceae bacterium]
MTEPATTPSQTVGPFLSIALPWDDGPDLVDEDGITIAGRLTDGAGAPVPDGLVEIWQADPDGRFAHPDDPRGAAGYPGFRSFGRCPTDADGGFAFRTLRPGRVDGEQAPHIDVTVFARGLLKQLVTRLYLPDESDANASDPTLRSLPEHERSRLIAIQDGAVLRFDIRLQGEGETPFFAV